VNAQKTDRYLSNGSEHPAFQGMLKHAAGCRRCCAGLPCVTFGVLVKTLREAAGKDT
jgi:hypothetical protein